MSLCSSKISFLKVLLSSAATKQHTCPYSLMEKQWPCNPPMKVRFLLRAPYDLSGDKMEENKFVEMLSEELVDNPDAVIDYSSQGIAVYLKHFPEIKLTLSALVKVRSKVMKEVIDIMPVEYSDEMYLAEYN